jgi:hypothetical protein
MKKPGSHGAFFMRMARNLRGLLKNCFIHEKYFNVMTKSFHTIQAHDNDHADADVGGRITTTMGEAS